MNRGLKNPIFTNSSLALDAIAASFSKDLPTTANGQVKASTTNSGVITYGPGSSAGTYGTLNVSSSGITQFTVNETAVTAQSKSKLSDTFSVTATNGTASTTANFIVSIANPTAVNTLLINATSSGSIDGISFGSTATTGAYAGTLLSSINLGVSADNASLTDAAGTTAALTLDGGDGFDRLNGNASANTLTLTGLNQGTLDQVSFSNIENVYLKGGNDTVNIESGGRLSGILDGGAGTNTLVIKHDSPITIDKDGKINVGGGSFTGFKSIQVQRNGGSQTNKITLNADSNTALVTGPNSGTVDGTGFTNISDINLAVGDDNAVLAASGSLIGTLDGGDGNGDALTLNAQNNTLTVDQAWTGSASTAGNNKGTSIAGFETIRLDGGADVANLSFAGTAAAANKRVLSLSGGNDSSRDTLNITLNDKERLQLEQTNQLKGLESYLAAPSGKTLTVSFLESAITFSEFESGKLSTTIPIKQSRVLSIADQALQAGKSFSIPIMLSDAGGLQSLDLTITYDKNVFSLPTNGNVITAGSLTSGKAPFVVNSSQPGQLKISWSGTSSLNNGNGSIAMLNLETKTDATLGVTKIDLVSASINEGGIAVSLDDGDLTILPPSFQVLGVRELPNGLALKLSEAPNLDTFNLYDVITLPFVGRENFFVS